jgi:methionyl-tRNA formyltransferase
MGYLAQDLVSSPSILNTDTMNFIYFGYDFMLGAVERLRGDGHVLKAVFSFPCDNIFNFNGELRALAENLNIPFSTEKPTVRDINHMMALGADIFIAAGYPYKIPPVPSPAYGINLHPSLLPKGRGMMPTPYILMNHPEAAGVTIHKMTQKFDGGDILIQRSLPLSPRETVETYSARVAMAGPELVSAVCGDIKKFWAAAMPQDETQTLYFPPPTEEMRMLDFSAGIDAVDKTARALGRFGALARFDDVLWFVYALDTWREDHNFTPGDIVCVLAREIVVAAKDGFVCIKEFQKAA